jgi:SAM-dependent methyltransferase
VRINETARTGFTAGADVYERARPTYPEEALAALDAELGLGPGRDVLDLAAGTGKLTRLLVARGANVTAVEPVPAMAAQLAAAVPGVTLLDGTAEAIPLVDRSVDVVTVGQAFHWFDAPVALAEIARVLRPGGGLALIWNNRDSSVDWVADVEELFSWPDLKPYDRDVDWAGLLEEAPDFRDVRHETWSLVQPVDADLLVDRVLSTSYVATWSAERQAELGRGIRARVAGFPPTFDLPYVTDVYWCRRR